MIHTLLYSTTKELTHYAHIVVKYHHKLGKHTAGTNHTLSLLSTKYWVISAREEIIDGKKSVQRVKGRKQRMLYVG